MCRPASQETGDLSQVCSYLTMYLGKLFNLSGYHILHLVVIISNSSPSQNFDEGQVKLKKTKHFRMYYLSGTALKECCSLQSAYINSNFLNSFMR